MARIFFEVDDLNKVLDSFKAMENDARSILHTAVNKGAEHLAPLIKSNIKPGTVDDIHVRDSVRVSKAKVKKTLKQSANILIGNKKTDYAFHLETGREGVPPRPYIRTTTDQHQEEVADIVGNTILDGLGL